MSIVYLDISQTLPCLIHAFVNMNSRHNCTALHDVWLSPSDCTLGTTDLVVCVDRTNNQITISISSIKSRTRLIRASTAINDTQNGVGYIRTVRRLIVSRDALSDDLGVTRVAHLDHWVAIAGDTTCSCAERVKVIVASDNAGDRSIGTIVRPALQGEEGSVEVRLGWVG